MALYQSDILQHNNPNLAVADSDFIKGGFRTAVSDLNGLYALSNKVDEPSAAGQLKEHSTIVYVTSESKYYVLVDIVNVGNVDGWDEFISGGVFDNALTGVTNLGTGEYLGGVDNRNVTIKSISGIGGISISGNSENIVISADTVTWGGIDGNIENQVDLINYVTGITITKLDITEFNSYTGITQPILDNALTGVTNLGTGEYLGDVDGRNVTIKSISGVGGISITSDDNDIVISADTVTWGSIDGNIENQVDLINYVTGITITKLDITEFNSYTGITQPILDNALTGVTNLGTGEQLGDVDGRNVTIKSISGIGGITITSDNNDIVISADTVTWGSIDGDIENQVDLINYVTGITVTKLDITEFNSYTGITETRLLDIEEVTDIALTGVTNLGTGEYLGGVDGRNVTIKSISGVGGISITSDDNDIVISADTVTWGSITGILSNQTDLQNVLNQSITGATNGLTKIGQDVKLGGDLNEDTLINGQNNNLNINNLTNFNVSANTINLNGQVEIEVTPPEGNVPGDWVLVRNLSDNGVKHVDTIELNDALVDINDVFDNALTGVTNLGTGEYLGGVDDRNVTIKSISGVGGISISGNSENIVISGSNETETLHEYNIVGDDTTTGFTINHNLNTRNIMIQIYELFDNYSNFFTNIERPTLNSIYVTFNVAPILGEDYKILISTK